MLSPLNTWEIPSLVLCAQGDQPATDEADSKEDAGGVVPTAEGIDGASVEGESQEPGQSQSAEVRTNASAASSGKMCTGQRKRQPPTYFTSA